MSISIYLILLIVLLVFNLVFWLLVIWFRILVSCDFGGCCSNSESSENEAPCGHGNPGYIDNESPASTFHIPEALRQAMESPPSYEDAIKYDRFGFQVCTAQTSPPSSSSPLPPPTRSDVPNNQQNTHVSSGGRPTQLSQSPPRQPDTSTSRSRSSTTGSMSLLTPIREEDDDETPITVVIDCIGVQASKLVENCDTKVNLSGGEQLNGHSKC